MSMEPYVFKCSDCKELTVHLKIKDYECADIPGAPGTVWEVECERCFTQRVIYPSERYASREDEIEKCSECGHLKMKMAKCRICRLASGEERLQVRIDSGHDIYYKDADL